MAAVLCSSLIIGQFETVRATGLEIPLSGAAADLIMMLMGSGMMVDMAELLKPKDTTDEREWWDRIHEPASQGQIDALNEKIAEYYDNAVRDWMKNHGQPTPSPKPTDSPPVNPPVTVPPIDPDTVKPPLTYEEMKGQMYKDQILDLGAMGVATFSCLKSALDDFLMEIFYVDEAYHDDVNTFSYDNFIGYVKYHVESDKGFLDRISYGYVTPGKSIETLTVLTSPAYDSLGTFYSVDNSDHVYGLASIDSFMVTDSTDRGYPYHHTYKTTRNNNIYIYGYDIQGTASAFSSEFRLYMPYYFNGVLYSGEYKPPLKDVFWTTPNIKDDFDNNRSPSFPEEVPPPIRIPTLDELKQMQQQSKENEEDRPVIIENFITNHYVQPTPSPEPGENPDPGGEPAPDPDPDPNPTESPDPDPSESPDPTGAPEPSGTPEEPDPDNPDVDPDAYKADLRDVFPFCIPFDLIRLLKVFQAEPRAPVFEFPVDLEFNNPFTGEKILDYHEVFVLDFADYEEVVKILRAFQVVFFIIGLMMITRSQMIKG